MLQSLLRISLPLKGKRVNMFVRSEDLFCCNQVNAALESVHSQVAGALRQNFEDLTGKREGPRHPFMEK